MSQRKCRYHRLVHPNGWKDAMIELALFLTVLLTYVLIAVEFVSSLLLRFRKHAAIVTIGICAVSGVVFYGNSFSPLLGLYMYLAPPARLCALGFSKSPASETKIAYGILLATATCAIVHSCLFRLFNT